MARISPVRGSSATAEPARPSKAFSIAACSEASIVRVRLGPSSGAWRSASATSRPRLFTMTRRKPSLPITSRLYSDSMPAWPTSEPGARPLYSASCSCRSVISPTRPSACAAAEASGYERRGTTSTLTSGSSRRRASSAATSARVASVFTTTGL